MIRFVFCYVIWRTIRKFEDTVKFYLLVAVNTKNAYDGSLGHVKRNMLQKML